MTLKIKVRKVGICALKKVHLSLCKWLNAFLSIQLKNLWSQQSCKKTALPDKVCKKIGSVWDCVCVFSPNNYWLFYQIIFLSFSFCILKGLSKIEKPRYFDIKRKWITSKVTRSISSIPKEPYHQNYYVL